MGKTPYLTNWGNNYLQITAVETLLLYFKVALGYNFDAKAASYQR
jgi:hypothetical protein